MCGDVYKIAVRDTHSLLYGTSTQIHNYLLFTQRQIEITIKNHGSNHHSLTPYQCTLKTRDKSLGKLNVTSNSTIIGSIL